MHLRYTSTTVLLVVTVRSTRMDCSRTKFWEPIPRRETCPPASATSISMETCFAEEAEARGTTGTFFCKTACVRSAEDLTVSHESCRLHDRENTRITTSLEGLSSTASHFAPCMIHKHRSNPHDWYACPFPYTLRQIIPGITPYGGFSRSSAE